MALFALGTWIAGIFAGGLHELTVRHGVCAEHGDVVDVALRGSDEPLAPAALDRADASANHDDGCAMPGLPAVLAGWMLPSSDPAESPSIPYDALASADARVAGPLRYAPKTSPPRT